MSILLLMAVHVTIVVFTQTGNTLSVADAVSDALRDAGHEALMLPTPLFAAGEVDIPAGGVVGVGSPAIYGRAPINVREYLAEVPGLAGVPAFVFATSMGASGRVLTDLGDALRLRGARVMGGAVVKAPALGRAPWLAGGAEGHLSETDLDRVTRVALTVADRVDRGSREPLPPVDQDGRPLSRADAHHGRYGFFELAGLLLDLAAVRRRLPVPVVDEHRCTRCRWCVENCPVGAIGFPEPSEWRRRAAGNGHLDELPEIDPEVCIRCYRCVACPFRAYEVEWAAADRLMRLVYHPRMIGWFGDGRRDPA